MENGNNRQLKISKNKKKAIKFLLFLKRRRPKRISNKKEKEAQLLNKIK
jgi:hypothetical protein